jgi:hypothetical protein
MSFFVLFTLRELVVVQLYCGNGIQPVAKNAILVHANIHDVGSRFQWVSDAVRVTGRVVATDAISHPVDRSFWGLCHEVDDLSPDSLYGQ